MRKRTFNRCLSNLGLKSNDEKLKKVREKLSINKDYFLKNTYDSFYNNVQNKTLLDLNLESHRIARMAKELKN